MFTKEPQEARAQPPSFLIGLDNLPASLRASHWMREQEEWGRNVQQKKMKHRTRQSFHRHFHMMEGAKRGETNIGINMRPHVRMEGLFGPLL